MSTNNTGCITNTQLSLGIALSLPSGNNIPLSFDNNYDIMLLNVNSGDVTLYTNANQIIIPNPAYYILAILNPENNTATSTGVTFIPTNPPSEQLYGFTITLPSTNTGQSASGVYTINISGVNAYFNPNVQNTVYLGYGEETPILSNTLFSINNLLQQLEAYYPLQYANAINDTASENPICGNLVGSPDTIVFTPSSSGSSAVSQAQPFVYGTTFYPNAPPLPPSPQPSKSNRDIVTLGVVGALALAGTIVSRKAK